MKARQFGFTTFYCIDMLDEALWVPGMSCAILANDRETSDKIFEIVRRAYENIPEEIRPGTRYDNKRMYQFTTRFDGVILDSVIAVAQKLRGGTWLWLHVTESAYVDDRQELNAGSKQAVPMDGRISEETTGNGFTDFYDFWTQEETKTELGPLDYKTHFYAWWENPEYTIPGTMPPITQEDKIEFGDEEKERARYNLTDGQLLWRRWKIRELKKKKAEEGIGLSGLQLFKQEYPANKAEAFQSGAGSVFDQAAVELIDTPTPLREFEINNYYYVPPEKQEELAPEYLELLELRRQMAQSLLKKGLFIWKLPEDDGDYVVGADPSDGLGSDFSGAGIWRKWPDGKKEQVAQFYNMVRPDEFAEILADIGHFYNHAFVGIENNMLSCILFFVKIYDNYFYTIKVDEKTAKKTKKIGWSTNSKTRDPMIDDFIMNWEEGTTIIRSKITKSEMRTFVKKDGGKREHADGKHDDALFGDMIALAMCRFERPKPRSFSSKPAGL